MESTVKNETFDLGRFGHELRSYLQDKRKELVPYGVSVISMLAIFTIGNLLRPMGKEVDLWNFAPIFYFTTLCLSVGVSSRAFIKLDTRTSALTEFTTPSSQLEKFLSRWIVSIVLPLVFCIVIMKGLEVVALKALTVYYTRVFPMEPVYLELMKTTFSVSFSWIIAITWLQAIFFLGSVAWRKYSALKTIAVITLTMILCVSVWGNYMPWLGITYSWAATILLITLVPVYLYYVAWVMYRRAQVK